VQIGFCSGVELFDLDNVAKDLAGVPDHALRRGRSCIDGGFFFGIYDCRIIVRFGCLGLRFRGVIRGFAVRIRLNFVLLSAFFLFWSVFDDNVAFGCRFVGGFLLIFSHYFVMGNRYSLRRAHSGGANRFVVIWFMKTPAGISRVAGRANVNKCDADQR
jgi:hypothetical protein